MDSDITTSSMSSSNGSGMMDSGAEGKISRVAQKAHQAVDKIEQTLGTSSEKMMGWQEEYGQIARDQVMAKPLQSVGIAFAVGVVFSKLFMR